MRFRFTITPWQTLFTDLLLQLKTQTEAFFIRWLEHVHRRFCRKTSNTLPSGLDLSDETLQLNDDFCINIFKTWSIQVLWEREAQTEDDGLGSDHLPRRRHLLLKTNRFTHTSGRRLLQYIVYEACVLTSRKLMLICRSMSTSSIVPYSLCKDEEMRGECESGVNAHRSGSDVKWEFVFTWQTRRCLCKCLLQPQYQRPAAGDGRDRLHSSPTGQQRYYTYLELIQKLSCHVNFKSHACFTSREKSYRHVA